MMDTREADRRLRQEFHSNAPSFPGIGRMLEARLAGSGTGREPGRGPARGGSGLSRRRLATAAAALIVLAAVGVGAWQAAAHLGGHKPIIVITDDTSTTDTAGTAASTSSTAAATSTTAAPGTSTTVGAGADFQGFWSGNVQTLPEHPASLPAEFYTQPAAPAQLVMGKPLWIFADELTPDQVLAAVKAADKKQALVIFDPSEALCVAVKMDKGTRPSQWGVLPAIFTQTPVLTRDGMFEDVKPSYMTLWAQLRRAGDAGSAVDPELAYRSAATISMQLENGYRGVETRKQEQQAQQRGETTTTVSIPPPPSTKSITVQSAQAQQLAQKVLSHLEDITGDTLEVQQAVETQGVRPDGSIAFRFHRGLIYDPKTKQTVDFNAYWSDVDQMNNAGYQLMPWYGGPTVSTAPLITFDVGAPHEGYLYAGGGYYCRLQLADGISAYTITGKSGTSVEPPVTECSLLTPEQLIAFTKWLAEQAEYLNPGTTTPTSGASAAQQLRIVNTGDEDITGLVVRFPDATVDFGDIPAGGTSEHRSVPGGVYRYAAYSYSLGGKTVTQPVADWVGESPMTGTKFTYWIALDSGQRVGAQITLVKVLTDSH